MNVKDEGQQWICHTLNGQAVAVLGELRPGAEMRSFAGMCELANGISLDLAKLVEKATLIATIALKVGHSKKGICPVCEVFSGYDYIQDVQGTEQHDDWCWIGNELLVVDWAIKDLDRLRQRSPSNLNALQQQVTELKESLQVSIRAHGDTLRQAAELEGKAALADEIVAYWKRTGVTERWAYEDFITKHSSLTSPSTIAQEEQR